MKTRIKIMFLCLAVSVSLIGLLIISIVDSKKMKPIDCNKPIDVIYLKPSELKYASELANKINGVVVIPEDNTIIGRSEVLLCPSFEASNYIDTGGLI